MTVLKHVIADSYMQEPAGNICGLQIEGSPRRIAGPPAPITHPLASGRYQSPLRYPGAKSGLATALGSIISAATSSRAVGNIDLLVEPFAGGASTSLRLVGAGVVDRVLLADADPTVAAFWQIAASETERLIDRMSDEYTHHIAAGPSSALERWDYWRMWSPPSGMKSRAARFEMAMRCLFLNRTTFSGILHGQAGPIGGRKQQSAYGIGCRFNVNALAERLRYVGHLYTTGRLVDVWCKDWRASLADVAEWYPQLLPDRVAAYLDPPYIAKSGKLYSRSFESSEPTDDTASDLEWNGMTAHRELATFLRRQIQYRWLLSYDADPRLLQDPMLFAAQRMTPTADDRVSLGAKAWHISKRLVSLSYTASARTGRGPASELLLTTFPPATVPLNDQIRAVTWECLPSSAKATAQPRGKEGHPL